MKTFGSGSAWGFIAKSVQIFCSQKEEYPLI